MPHNLQPSDLSQRLIDIAKADDIISADEQAIIDSVKANIGKYFEVFHESYDDEVITSDEQNSMYELRKQIMEQALIVAKSDDQITQEEFALLKVLKEILEDMEYNEHY